MNKKLIFVGMVLSILSVANASYLWTDPCGTSGSFSWANGQSQNGLFGDPLIVGGNTLVFFPSDFRAESSNGSSASISDRLEFELIAHPGFSFQNIAVSEYGDYAILGDALVQFSGTLTIENLDTYATSSNSLSVTPTMPVVGGHGAFQGWTTLNLIPSDWTHIKFILENTLFSLSGEGSSSYIQNKVLGDTAAIQIMPIPEPATVMILGFGAFAISCDFLKKRQIA